MPYAANDRVSTAPFKGAVEITNEEYTLAIEEMSKGNALLVDGGLRFVPRPDTEPPSNPATRSLSAEELLAFLVDEGVVPSGTTVQGVLKKLLPAQRN
jgi:hypothetical protein